MTKVFISHAHRDADLAKSFQKLLLRGGVGHRSVFCSSIDGAIPNGTMFVTKILAEIQAASLVVALVSRDYLRSAFCNAEAGIGHMKALNGSQSFMALFVPPVSREEMRSGVFHGVQCGSIQDSGHLDQIPSRIGTRGATDEWRDARAAFLSAIRGDIKRRTVDELVSRVRMLTFWHDRPTEPETFYTLKLFAIFVNETGKSLTVRKPLWAAKARDLRTQEPFGSGVQFEGRSGPNTWALDNQKEIQVPNQRFFRIWIGVEPRYSDKQFLTHIRSAGWGP